MTDDLPELPYAGTSGWSGSEASRERAERRDSDGTTEQTQQKVMRLLTESGTTGMTWPEVDTIGGFHHHGTTTGALSALHKKKRIARLTEKRAGCSVYVIPENVIGRETAAQGRKKKADEADDECPTCDSILAVYESLQQENRHLKAVLDSRGIKYA